MSNLPQISGSILRGVLACLCQNAITAVTVYLYKYADQNTHQSKYHK